MLSICESLWLLTDSYSKYGELCFILSDSQRLLNQLHSDKNSSYFLNSSNWKIEFLFSVRIFSGCYCSFQSNTTVF